MADDIAAERGATPPLVDETTGADAAVDPLLSCLEFLTRHYDRPYSAEVLKAGLPLEGGQLTASLFVRAASRAGLLARVAKRPLKALTNVLLPAVLILKEGEACVLLELRERGRAVVMLPEAGGGAQEIATRELSAMSAGYVIFARPIYHAEDAHEARSSGASRRWFWGPLLENWWVYGQVVLAAALINTFALASPLFIMTVYDRVVPNNALDTLWVLAIGAAIVVSFDFAVRSLRGYYIDVAGKRADVVLASRIFDQVLDIQMAARPASAGAFANTLREFETVRDVFTSATLATLVDLPFLFFFIGVIWLIGGPLALVPAATVPAVLMVGVMTQIPLNSVIRSAFRENEAKHGVLFETLGGLETIKSVGAEGRMRYKWETNVGLAAKSSLRARLLSVTALNFAAAAQQLSLIAIVFFGVLLIGDGALSVGALIACVILNGRAVGMLAQVAQLLIRVNQARTSLKALHDLMKRPVERPAAKQFLHRPRIAGAIEFRNVSFTYAGQPEAALRGVSFSVAAGERVGLIGRVGSGKSTLNKLLLGLYEPESGSILVDGTELRQIDPVDLRRNIGCVPQDVFLFGGSVRENITIGAPHAGDEAVLAAARLAGVEEFVGRHPLGYDLPVGERGEGLSGGQRQAIAVARALILDPPIIVLDEPTGSMDNASEVLLKESLAQILPGKTLLLVTHRTSLLSIVDRLIVLDRGAVVADGPKQAVLEAISEGRVAMLRH